MFERQLTRLIQEATRRVVPERSALWAAIGVAAYVARRSLRQGDQVRQLRVRPGREVSIAVRDRTD